MVYNLVLRLVSRDRRRVAEDQAPPSPLRAGWRFAARDGRGHANSVKSLFSVLAALTFAGCTVASAWTPLAQGNFAYPNSNVIPMKHAEGSSSRIYLAPFQIPDFTSGAQIQEAVNSALQTSGGDILIDGSYTMKTRMIYLMYLEIYITDVSVDGTAAKMEIGRRNLK